MTPLRRPAAIDDQTVTLRVDSGAGLNLDLRRSEVSLQFAQLNEDIYLSFWAGTHGTARLSELCVVERLGAKWSRTPYCLGCSPSAGRRWTV
jgi:hypothetical protein